MDIGEVIAAEIVSGVFVVDGINGIRSHIGPFGGFGHRRADLLFELDRRPAHRVMHIENRRAGILANRRGICPGKVNIFEDGLQRPAGSGTGLL